ncbi:DUF4168 domain-containing protein [Marinobacter caseinilyticus]|uniref:DUF4168 domain-containing protein n=1 Tax=Marinobacter caseinilyticus TaxID=2692195 RepID=UPI00140E73B0|nr:DUF4168 domain-containing protein [Marinobacter caseinilyticus]
MMERKLANRILKKHVLTKVEGRFMKIFLVAITVLTSMLAMTPAMADDSKPAISPSEGFDQPVQANAQATDFADTKLKQFGEAQANIDGVRRQYLSKIEASESKKKAQKLQVEANEKMVGIIKATGLDIPTYNAIASAYHNEPGIRKRVDELM